jgi:hypothetical protein
MAAVGGCAGKILPGPREAYAAGVDGAAVLGYTHKEAFARVGRAPDGPNPFGEDACHEGNIAGI